MNIVKLIIAAIFFFGGIVLFTVATSVSSGFEAVTFLAGIVAISLAFALPIHVFSRS